MCLRAPRAGFDGGRPRHVEVERSETPQRQRQAQELDASTTTIGAAPIPFTPLDAERTPGAVICDIHPWMSAWWMVLDHPYFAVTDAKGNYEIKNVPGRNPEGRRLAGSRERWRVRDSASGEDVAIKAGDATVKDFTIDPGKLLPAS